MNEFRKAPSDCIIRQLRPDEYGIVRDFLYEAIFVPAGTVAPARDVVYEPYLRIYHEDFGTGCQDRAWCAQVGTDIIGCIWCRKTTTGYGSVAEEFPELAMSVKPSFRGYGIGTQLLHAMLQDLEKDQCPGISLSVQKANYAYKMYLKAGFRIVRETDEEYIMVRKA